jgi:hypothetical protein
MSKNTALPFGKPFAYTQTLSTLPPTPWYVRWWRKIRPPKVPIAWLVLGEKVGPVVTLTLSLPLPPGRRAIKSTIEGMPQGLAVPVFDENIIIGFAEAMEEEEADAHHFAN